VFLVVAVNLTDKLLFLYIYICCFITNFSIFRSTFSVNLKGKWRFSFSNDGFPSSWNFKISKSYWLMGSRLAEMHHRAKFRRNWYIRCGDNDFSIFQKGSRHHLGFLNF